MKYIATVTKILHSGIHKVGKIENGQVKPLADLPLPNRVEILLKGVINEPCLMYRYADSGEFCGDSWHENLQSAFAEAAYKYGLSKMDFKLVPDQEAQDQINSSARYGSSIAQADQGLVDEITALLGKNKPLEAIQVYIRRMQISLWEAKAVIDSIKTQL